MSIIQGPTSACETNTSTFFVLPIPGATYDWNVGPNGVIIGGQFTDIITVLWNFAGFTTVDVTILVFGVPDPTPTHSVTINAIVTPTISGPLTACEDTLVMYSTPPVMGASYLWSAIGGTISGPDNMSDVWVSWDLPGSGQIIISVDNGCPSSPVSENVNILLKPIPIISGDSDACAGNTKIYTTSNAGIVSFLWTVSNGIIIGANNTDTVNIQWDVIGTGIVSLTVNNGNCDSDYVTKEVIVSALPAPPAGLYGFDEVYDDNQHIYYAPYNPYSGTYEWDVTGGTIIYEATPPDYIMVLWGTPGTGEVSLTISNGSCESTALTLSVNKKTKSPSGFTMLRNETKEARSQRDISYDRYRQAIEDLASVQSQISAELSLGTSADPNLLYDEAELTHDVGRFEIFFDHYRSLEIQKQESLLALGSLSSLLPNLEDNYPILLSPVRLETKFRQDSSVLHYLMIRIFPDDISIETHENLLTAEEKEAGDTYWNEILDTSSTSVSRIGAWNALAGRYSPQRAAWIALRTDPSADPDEESRYHDWARQPEVRTYPDRFVAIVYRKVSGSYTQVCEIEGNTVPDRLKVSIDPVDENSLSSDSGTAGEYSEIVSREDISWLTDFNAAINNGMGIKINLLSHGLTNSDIENGEFKVLVLGVKISSDKDDSKTLAENLINNHHYTANGFGLLKTGSATTNTTYEDSSFTTVDPGSKKSHSIERGSDLYTPTSVTANKADAQWLAESLGLDYDVFTHVENANNKDMANALMLNDVLWQATVGYKLGSFWNTAVTKSEVEATRNFFIKYVSGRGMIPSIRVSRQPYGILPASVFSEWAWAPTEPDKTYLDNYSNTAAAFRTAWTDSIPYVTTAGGTGDPDQNIMDLFTQQAVSVDYYHQFATGPDYVWNQLSYYNRNADAQTWFTNQETAANNVLTNLGITAPANLPKALMMNYIGDFGQMYSPLVQAGVLKDAPLKTLPGISGNYLLWLSESSLATIRAENFGSGTPPTTILYFSARYSVLLEYWHAAMDLLIEHGAATVDELAEREFFNFFEEVTPPPGVEASEVIKGGKSRWAYLDMVVPTIDPVLTVGQYLDSPLSTVIPARANLLRVKSYLTTLSNVAAKDLDLAVREVLDLSTYRLDAWQLGMAHHRLQKQRNLTGTRVTGLYLGAYGWVLDLVKADRTTLSGGVEGISGSIESRSLLKGFIHAPSLNHAKAAAVLKSGYDPLADQGYENAAGSPRQITLTSEKVRTSLRFIEGIRNGQLLGALLGYEFERGLHERYPGEQLDVYIYQFRKKYIVDQITDYPSDAQAESIQANNVVDGLKLYEATRKYEHTLSYPYDVEGLPAIGSSAGQAIEKELDRLAIIIDAIGDLAMSEAAYHLVQNNQEAASAILEALGKGRSFPNDIQVIETPRSGKRLTNRFTLHFDSSVNTSDGWPGTYTIRAEADPYINKWLGTCLGDPGSIFCKASYTINAGQTGEDSEDLFISAEELGIQPVDFLHYYPAELKNDDSDLTTRLRFVVREKRQLSVDVDVIIDFAPNLDVTGMSGNNRTFYDVLPLVNYLKKIQGASRSLKPEDYTLDGKGVNSSPASGFYASELYYRILHSLNKLQELRTRLLNGIDDIDQTSFTTTDLNDLKALLLKASEFGISGVIPGYAWIDEASVSVRDGLITLARSAVTTIDNRLKTLSTSFDDIDESISNDKRAAVVEELQRIAKILFGDSFSVVALFKFYNTGELNLAYNASDSILPGTPLAVDEWIQSAGKVRQRLADMEMANILSEAISGKEDSSIKPIQLPYNPNASAYKWQAVAHEPPVKMTGDTLSIVVQRDEDSTSISILDYQCGFFIDEWVEIIPEDIETTGIAMNYNQPTAQAPNSLLLAITPSETGNWNWTNLVKTLNETLDLTMERGVDQEHLADTDFGAFMNVLYSAYNNLTGGATSTNVTINSRIDTAVQSS